MRHKQRKLFALKWQRKNKTEITKKMEKLLDSLLTQEELKNAVHGKILEQAQNSKDFSFTSVVTDSRQVKPKSLFIPLIGEFQDGHKYIPQAIERGASVVFVTKSIYDTDVQKYTSLAFENPQVTFIVVENNLYALQFAARSYVEKFPSLIKIAITGSSGKTTTKEIMASILRQKYKLVATEGNLNSETGLPLSVFKIKKEHEVALFEMGMNRENEIGEIANVFKPTNAIITNIGNAHIGILKSRENIANEKKKIFNYIGKNGIAVIHNKDDFADFLAQDIDGKIVYFGFDIPEEISGVKFIQDLGINGTRFSVDGFEATLKIPGSYNYLNALSCIAMAKALGIPSKQIVDGINILKAPQGRSCVKSVITKQNSSGSQKKITLFDDCYNANPDSMESAIKMCSALKISGRKIFILGDMAELGEKSKDAHTQIGIEACHANPNLLILIGQQMKNAVNVAQSNGYNNFNYYSDLSDENLSKISSLLLEYLEDEDFIFVKASHSMQLEKILTEIIQRNVEEKEE